jgi:serine-type D-Ala-D-Ala carboxypeptidase/endopeptidase (penicillin-binding protein 4)
LSASFARAALAAVVVSAFAPPSASAQAGPGSVELARALERIVDDSALANARVGILVASVETGRVVYARDPDVLLNPASNVKLFTSAAALARLGPEYRFETEFYVDGRSTARPGATTLYVRGKGDPTLVTERLWSIAGELAQAGVAKIGDIVLDDRYFDGERVGPGYDQETGDRAYLAPTGALSLNFNAVEVRVGSGDRARARGRVAVEPASDFFAIENRTLTVGARQRRQVVLASHAADGRQKIVVSGSVPLGSRPQSLWRRIDDPPRYFGYTLQKLLAMHGVKATGKVRLGAVPADAKLVHVAQSEPLSEVVRRLNKSSNNFTAEQILKTLGAEAKGAPGTWGKGIAATEEILAELGLPRGSYLMRNGSGLNDANRFSARQTVTLLRAMWGRFPLMAEFLASLPVAGRDGTIRRRFGDSEAAGRLRAKTGTLDNVVSLAGFVETAAGEPLAFAVFANDYPTRAAPIRQAVDALGGALAASGGTPGELDRAVARAKTPALQPVAAVAKDVSIAARTIYALARAGDRRNLVALRTALATESDPVLRLAIAEGVYLSDPDGEASQALFLEAAGSDPQGAARLHAAAADPQSPAPVLASLATLAESGSPEALARLVELAPANGADPRYAGAYGDALAQVAATVPEDVLSALREAPASAAEPATLALGGGLGRSGRDHPLLVTLAAQAAKAGEAGAFARELGKRLGEAAAVTRQAGAHPALVPTPAAAKKP